MSTVPCSDCGQQVSKQAPKCPHCGKPRLQRRGCLFQIIALILFVAVAIWWMTTGLVQQSDQMLGQIKDKVAEDAVAQYKIAADQGDRVQRCVQAGYAAGAFLQAQDSTSYNEWKAVQKRDCKAAHVPI